jgi:hypothetical protein
MLGLAVALVALGIAPALLRRADWRKRVGLGG